MELNIFQFYSKIETNDMLIFYVQINLFNLCIKLKTHLGYIVGRALEQVNRT
jgi:hypothetical protein